MTCHIFLASAQNWLVSSQVRLTRLKQVIDFFFHLRDAAMTRLMVGSSVFGRLRIAVEQ